MLGNCIGQADVMYPPPYTRRSNPKRRYPHQEKVNEAIAVCAGCPALQECRTRVIEDGEAYGVWAGIFLEDNDRVREAFTEEELATWRRNRYQSGMVKHKHTNLARK